MVNGIFVSEFDTSNYAFWCMLNVNITKATMLGFCAAVLFQCNFIKIQRGSKSVH